MEGVVKIPAGRSSGKPDFVVVSQVHIGAELLTVSDSTANLSKFKKLFRATEGFAPLTQRLQISTTFQYITEISQKIQRLASKGVTRQPESFVSIEIENISF